MKYRIQIFVLKNFQKFLCTILSYNFEFRGFGLAIPVKLYWQFNIYPTEGLHEIKNIK